MNDAEKTKLKDILDLVERLVLRAVRVVNSIEGYDLLEEDDRYFKFIKLSLLDDGQAKLSWPETDYDSYGIESEERLFPAELLFINDVELASWEAKCREAARKKEEQRKREMVEAAEANQRKIYEDLKKKFG